MQKSPESRPLKILYTLKSGQNLVLLKLQLEFREPEDFWQVSMFYVYDFI